MKKTRDGKRRFSREFKMAAVRRVIEGESPHAVARDLDVKAPLLWRWRKQVAEKGENELKEVGRPKGSKDSAGVTEAGYQRRIAELERLAGRQQMEIRFLDKALGQVEELRQEKNDDGAAASTKR
jgi:transposase-like protein